MSNLGGIIRKEVKELLTPATIIPLVIFALIFGLIGNSVSDIKVQLQEKPVIGVINHDTGPVAAMAAKNLSENAKIVYSGTLLDEGLNAVEQNGGIALIVIPVNFTAKIESNTTAPIEVYWYLSGSGITDSIPLSMVDGLIATMNANISKSLVGSSSQISPSVILKPTKNYDTTIFKGKEMAGISPSVISSVISQQSIIVPLIVVMVIMMSGSTVITSMGSEKENKTLETLLTMPVNRSTIVVGKLIGATIVGLIGAVIYMLGFGYYMNGITGSSPINLEQYGMSLDLFDYFLVGVLLFLALTAALAICMILGIFTKNYKAAQTMTMPIVFLALIPMFLLMFMDFDTMPIGLQILLFAIPFSHPMMAIKNLMFGNVGLVLAGIGYVAVFTLFVMFIAVTLFKKDILLIGISKKGNRRKTGFPLIDLILRATSKSK